MEVEHITKKEFEQVLRLYIDIKRAGHSLSELQEELQEIDNMTQAPGVILTFHNEELLFEFMYKILLNYREVTENPIGFRNVLDKDSFLERLKMEVNLALKDKGEETIIDATEIQEEDEP